VSTRQTPARLSFAGVYLHIFVFNQSSFLKHTKQQASRYIGASKDKTRASRNDVEKFLCIKTAFIPF